MVGEEAVDWRACWIYQRWMMQQPVWQFLIEREIDEDIIYAPQMEAEAADDVLSEHLLRLILHGK